MGLSRKIFLALLALSVLQTLFYFPQLPDVAASHFDGAGRPNGWMPRLVFCIFYLVMMLVMWFSFLYLPERVMRWRATAWNIPNSGYWLAPGRRERTERWVVDQTIWCGVATLVFMIWVFQLAFEANLGSPARLSGEIVWALVAYFLYIAVWLVAFFVHFMRVPPDAASTEPSN